MDIRDQFIVVIGAARSGVAAARLLHAHGAKVLVTDSGPISQQHQQILNDAGISFEQGRHSERAYQAEWVVVSPGVPEKAPIMKFYAGAGIPIYSEIEAASWFSQAPMVAITGSNGKTTVTTWLGHLWQTAEVPGVTAGNIGNAFSDVVPILSTDVWALLEVSSFQLNHIDRFRPKISCILNITPDHLDRYEYKFENYAASKMRLVSNQSDGDVFICWNEDPVVSQWLRAHHGADTAVSQESASAPVGGVDKATSEGPTNLRNGAKIWRFSSQTEVSEGIFVRDKHIYFRINHQEEYLMHIDEIGLRGVHNLHNGLAVALAARAAEIRIESIRESLMKFEGVEHRLEPVRVLDGVRYINDSKATNVNAVWYALDSVKEPMVLILGGRDKGNDYSEIASLVREKVHTIIAIGEGREAVSNQLTPHVPHLHVCETMEDAVRAARKSAKRGEVVLLSPACASFDMFENYEHRGREFKKFVNAL